VPIHDQCRLNHEKLDVYQLALDFVVQADAVIEALPRGKRHITDQLARASLSIVLNLAEGTGKHTRLDKRRYYLMARGSATESAALLDVCLRLGLLDKVGYEATKSVIVRIVSMLFRLAQSCGES